MLLNIYHRKNKCTWNYQADNGLCDRRWIGKYCAYHNYVLKKGRRGIVACIVCLKGVKGKTCLCTSCGGHRFRELARYYKRRYNISIHELDYLAGNY